MEHSNHEVLRVEFNDDMYLPLSRHWTIQESLLHSLPITSSIKVWTGQWQKKIKELIAVMGMPQTQSNEQYHYMEQKYGVSHQKFVSLNSPLFRYKDDFMKQLLPKAEEYHIKNLKIISFTAQKGYGYKYTAIDVAIAVNALLELRDKKDPEINFHSGRHKRMPVRVHYSNF